MKAIEINAEKRTVEVTDKAWGLEALQAAVGGYIENASVLRGTTVYVNEEGLLSDPEFFFSVPGLTNGILAGNVVVLGCTPQGGDCDVPQEAMLLVTGIQFFKGRVE